jgi:hypothetical protein
MELKIIESTVTIFEIELEALEIHEYAGLTPVMSELEYSALKLDIESKGQKDPGVLFKGKVLDGRHRLRALAELGAATMKFTKLPNNTTLDEVLSVVRSKETRRHDSVAQKAIMAYNHMKMSQLNETQEQLAIAYGVARKRIGEAKKIDVIFGRRDILDWVFNGNKFNTGTESKPNYTDSLLAIINWLEVNSTLVKIPSVLEIITDSRDELTPEESMLVSKVVNQIGKEREAVRKAISSRVYAALA